MTRFGKRDPALLVLGKFAAENRAHIWREPAALDQHLHPRRDDVMLDADPVGALFLASAGRRGNRRTSPGGPCKNSTSRPTPAAPHWLVDPSRGCRAALSCKRARCRSLFPHELGTAPPETLPIDPESRENDLVLHVARAQRLVVIVNDCDRILRCGHGSYPHGLQECGTRGK